jgi:Rad3-related DNA helicase
LSVLWYKVNIKNQFKRKSIPETELILIPYNSLIHKQTREQLGIKLEESIIIIDEAHNLIDSITSINGSKVSLEQVKLFYLIKKKNFKRY